MEKLQQLLTEYNKQYVPNESRCSWSEPFCESTFPKYWYEVFKAVSSLDRSLRILEIGCGQGDVTSIFCYLGFKHIDSFERDCILSQVAENKIKYLFNRNDTIHTESFPSTERYKSDVLVLVNCVYCDGATNKEEYIENIQHTYDMAGKPQVFIFEVIDPSYDVPDDTFPYHVRLNYQDIQSMFPASTIEGIETYRYPINKRSKRLYIIRDI